jgi:hypothetical protein
MQLMTELPRYVALEGRYLWRSSTKKELDALPQISGEATGEEVLHA